MHSPASIDLHHAYIWYILILAMLLPRLVQQASTTGGFYISGVTPERVQMLNDKNGLNLAVGSPITQPGFSSTIVVTDRPKPTQVNKKFGVSMGWTKYGGLEKAHWTQIIPLH